MRHSVVRLALLASAIGVGGMAAVPAAADTLREALTEAYRSNPTLQAARARQRATDETVPLEKSAGRPNASATAQHIEFLRQASTNFTAPARAAGIGVDLSVPL